jgi:hypothetical protein
MLGYGKFQIWKFMKHDGVDEGRYWTEGSSHSGYLGTCLAVDLDLRQWRKPCLFPAATILVVKSMLGNFLRIDCDCIIPGENS